MLIDLDRFKARNPLLDLTFYAALLTTLAMLVPLIERAWREKALDAADIGASVAPLTAWLVLHGYVRGKGVEAAGVAQAAAATAPTPFVITTPAPLTQQEHDELAEQVRAAYAPSPTSNPPAEPEGLAEQAEPSDTLLDGETVIDNSPEA